MDINALLLSNIPRAPRRTDTTTLRAVLAAAGIERTPRAVQHKLQALSASYPIRCIDSSRPFQWQWLKSAPDYEYPPMSPHAALTLKMADEYLAPLLPRATLVSLRSRVQRADEVLAQGRGSVSLWRKKVRVLPRGINLRPPAIEVEVLAVVYDALLESRRFEVMYRRRSRTSLERFVVNPIALVVRGSVLALVCTLGDATELRNLYLHRMRSPKLQEASSWVPAGFDIDRYIREGHLAFRLAQGVVALELLVDPIVAETLEETPLAEDQKLSRTRGGRFRVRVSMPETMELHGWLKSYGAMIEVVKPRRLRKVIAAQAADMAALYG